MEENKNEQEKNIENEEVELESAAARRLRLLGVENDDKIHDTEAEIKTGNFFANLWYKHKWAIIISAFFIVVFTALIVSCTVKKLNAPDMYIAYNGPKELDSGDYELLNKYFLELIPDHTENGKTDISWSKNLYRTDAQQEEYKSESTSFSNSANQQALEQISYIVNYGAIKFLLCDKAVYDNFSELFIPVTSLVGEGYEDITYKDGGIILCETEFAKCNPTLAEILPKDTVICIPKSELSRKPIENEIALLKAILEYKKGE